MGLIVQPLYTMDMRQKRIPSISPQMNNLFQEFLRRFNEWKAAQKHELSWLTAVMTLGLMDLTCLMYSFYTLGAPAALFLLFIGALRHYLKIKKISSHLYINVHILHHHLLGKLEVGFCDHQGPCQCAEAFRKYVWTFYGISLYGDSL